MFDVLRRSMMARLASVAAVALVTGGAQTRCSVGDPDLLPRDLDSGDGPTFTTTLALEDSAGAAQGSFRRGELITFELTVRNRTSQPVTVDLATPLQADFLVFRNGADTPLWRYSEGRAFATVITPFPFGPHETRVIRITWDQVLADGSVLPRGQYEARGAVAGVGVLPTALASHELASTLQAFSID